MNTNIGGDATAAVGAAGPACSYDDGDDDDNSGGGNNDDGDYGNEDSASRVLIENEFKK